MTYQPKTLTEQKANQIAHTLAANATRGTTTNYKPHPNLNAVTLTRADGATANIHVKVNQNLNHQNIIIVKTSRYAETAKTTTYNEHDHLPTITHHLQQWAQKTNK